MKLLLVEDELPSLRGLKQKLQELEFNVEIVGEAFNGEIALSMIKETHPDIVFTDVKMPVMDGIELIRRLRQQYPDIISVIVSGYNDFEYARMALKLNVEDYLLKPVSKGALSGILNICSEKLKKRDEANQVSQMRSVVMGSSEAENTFNIKTACRLCYACFGNLPAHGSEMVYPIPKELSLAELTAGANEELNNRCKLFVLEGNFANERYFVVASKEAQVQIGGDYITSLYAYLRKKSPYPVTMICSENLKGMKDAGAAVKLMREQLHNTLVLNKSQMMYIGQLGRGESLSQIFTFDKINYLVILFHQNQRRQIEKEMKSCLETFRQNDYPLSLIERELKSLFNSLKGAILADVSFLDFEKSIDINNLFLISRNYDELVENVLILLEELLNRQQHYGSTKMKPEQMVEETEKLMQSNISGQLTLQEICETMDVSQAYLCRIFKEIRDVSPINYYIGLKINKACEYIEQFPEVKFKDIALMVGYDNPHYFSKLFKSVTGSTPSEFKNRADNA